MGLPLPKIPDAKEIADLTTKATKEAMQPLLDELKTTNDLLREVMNELREQNGKDRAA